MNTLTAWHRQMAASIAAAHPITPAVPVRARGVHLAADNDEPEPELTADMVRAMVSAKWPGLLDSPLAQAMHGASAMAQLEASDADDAIARHEHAQMRSAAMEHALACMWARDGWTVDTLANNIESAFGMDLDGDECDEIARQALGKTNEKEEAEDDEPLICIGCNGSGEGHFDGTRCNSCRGSGTERRTVEEDDEPFFRRADAAYEQRKASGELQRERDHAALREQQQRGEA